MELFSKELVSDEYLTALRQDMAQATICRFLIAYVSEAGLRSIGWKLLCSAFRDKRSFGIASLSCNLGYEPLLRLQKESGSRVDARLKYFMDPMVRGSNGPGELALLHSKLVYLLLEEQRRSIVYVGSHNWTERALGPGGLRNAEASIRYEMDLTPEDLDGKGTSVASRVNMHLLNAWHLPLCLPATEDNRLTFEEWFEIGCRKIESVPLQNTTIVLTVLKGPNGPANIKQLSNLQGCGIYMQVLEEEEGKTVWDSDDRLLVLVWKSITSLQAGEQPVLLNCRTTTNKAGPESQLRGTNQSLAPITGFKAIIFDEQQLNAKHNLHSAKGQSARIWSGRMVDYFDFKFPTQHSESSQVDKKVDPTYQFYLEVEKIIFPAEGDIPENPRFVWTRETFAVAEKQNSAKFERKPGFYVEPDLRNRMFECLEKEFRLNLKKARILPFSEMDRFRIGKRVSRHPLHETYMGKVFKEGREAFYANAAPGALVADIDELPMDRYGQQELLPTKEHISRGQRVFTMPLSHLFTVWKNIAKKMESGI